MTINPDPSTPPPPPPPPSAVCGNCGADEGRLLHHVRHRSVFRRLCTNCVLRLHPQSFCPSCFSLYPLHLPPSDTVSCSKCYSSTHPHCLLGPVTSSPYVCPPCRNPALPFFAPEKIPRSPGGFLKKIDGAGARVLLAAAKIAAFSMGKAAVAARTEAERRARDAASTRKKARVALEHVATLVGRERPRGRRESGVEASGVVDGAAGEVSDRLNAVGLREGEREVQGVGASNGVQMVGTSNGVQMVGASNGLQVHTPEKVVGEGNAGPQ